MSVDKTPLENEIQPSCLGAVSGSLSIANGTEVVVRSGDKIIKGNIEKSEWDFDQWTYFVNGEWYCQSEVNCR